MSQFIYPPGSCEQEWNIVERHIPLGVFPVSVGLQKLEVNVPKHEEQRASRTSELMHDKQAALAHHSPRVSHQKIKVDIFSKVIGHDAVELPFQNHVFRSAVNEFHVAQLEMANLVSGDVQVFLIEFHTDNAALGKEPRDFAGQNTGPTGLLEDSVGCFRNFLENLSLPLPIKPER